MNKIILSAALFLCAFMQIGFAQNTPVSAKFNQSLQRYYTLKNALAEDNAPQAAKSAADLRLMLKAVPYKGFAAGQQQELWLQESAVILAQSAELAKSNELTSQRKNFEEISTAFIKLVKALKINNDPVFVEYCPMGKFSWLNEVKTIQNPYYGSAMHDCGTVKETLEKE